MAVIVFHIPLLSRPIKYKQFAGVSLKELSDSCILLPENKTYHLQELHLPI